MPFPRLMRWLLLLTLTGMGVSPVGAQWPVVVPLQVRSGSGYLGLRPVDIDADRAKALKLKEVSGVEVSAVQEGAAAYQAGIRPGDVILSYNGEKILGTQQLIRLVSETPAGRRVLLVYWRTGQQNKVWVTTSSRPEATEDLEVISTMRAMDVPTPIMLWRNVVLGIESESLSDQLAQALGVKQGILIWTVVGGSPAQHAGLQAGDVVTGVCGRTIHSPRDVGLALQQTQSERKSVSIDVTRAHKAMSISIPVDSEDR
jgi:serine protease Do